MKEFFLIFGKINKKLIILLFLVIFTIIHVFYIQYILKSKANVIITELSSSIGHIAIIMTPYIKPFAVHKNYQLTQKNQKKNFIFDYSIFLSTHLINLLLLFGSAQTKPQSTKESNILFLASDIHKLYSIGSFEIIFVIIVSFLLLKSNYYIHHYLSLIIIILLSIAIDFILEDFHYEMNINFFLYIIVFIAQLLCESINLTYQKYMFDVLYYSPYHICFAFGILFLLYNIGTIIVFEITHNYEYKNYFKDINIGYEIFKFISNIFMVFFLYISMALTNFYFGPNHLIVNNELGNMIIFLLKSESKIKYYSIILFVIQFFFLMVFLELIELNFCNLNKNTKRKIQIRANDDIDGMNNIRNSSCEVIPGYNIETDNNESNELILSSDKKQTNMEMQSMN